MPGPDKRLSAGECGFLFETNMQTNKRGIRPATAPAPELDPTAAVILGELLEKIMDGTFEDAASNCFGLSRLLEHHPALQREVSALRRISAADDVIRRFVTTTLHTPERFKP